MNEALKLAAQKAIEADTDTALCIFQTQCEPAVILALIVESESDYRAAVDSVAKLQTEVTLKDGRIADLEAATPVQPVVEAASERTFSAVDEMLETNQLDELAHEVARLQNALCFWLPSVTDREDEVAERILQDAFLLCGIDGNIPDDFKTAQELGWVALAPSIIAPVAPEFLGLTGYKAIDGAREYLVDFMMAHFNDKTFHRYIRGEQEGKLAGDFAFELARAIAARPVPPEGQEAPVEQSVWPQFTVGQWLTSKCFGPVEFNGMDTYGSEVSYMFRSPQYGMRYLGLDRLADNFDLPEFAGSRPRSAPEYDPETVIARLPEILSRLEAAHLAGRQHSDETGLSYAVRVMGEWDLPDAPRSLPVEALTDEQIVAVVDSYDWSDFEYSYDEQIKFARAILKLAVERG